MKEKFGSYKDFLIKDISNYKGDFNKIIIYTPHFFSLLCDLLNEEKITREMKHLINAALAYFVTPVDLIPEEIYGPYGYIDDLFLCTHVLKKVADELGVEFLEKLWEPDEDLQDVLDRCYEESEKVMQEKGLKDEIFRYVGLV